MAAHRWRPPAVAARLLGVDERRALAGYGAARVAIGTSLAVAPRLATRWIGDDAGRPGGAVAVRLLGFRDALLGLATLLAVREGAGLRRWALLGATADAADAAVTVLARRRLPPGGAAPAAVAAGAAAAAGVWLARRLD